MEGGGVRKRWGGNEEKSCRLFDLLNMHIM